MKISAKKFFSNLTVILISSIHALAWERVVDQIRLTVVIPHRPETIANTVDTLNVVANKKIDIFHIEEELNSSVHTRVC